MPYEDLGDQREREARFRDTAKRHKELRDGGATEAEANAILAQERAERKRRHANVWGQAAIAGISVGLAAILAGARFGTILLVALGAFGLYAWTAESHGELD